MSDHKRTSGNDLFITQLTFGGRKYHKSWTAINNRMDLLVLDNWYIGELSPLELYDFGGGNVVAPVPDISSTTGTASYLTSHMLNVMLGHV